MTLIVLVAGASLAAGAFASQMDSEGQPWPRHELTIHDTTQHWASTRLAIEQWNLSRIGIHFKLTNSPKADVTIRIGHQSQCGQKGCGAHASWIGYRGHPEIIYLRFLPVPGGEGRVDYDTVRIISHELGHILGLEHTSSCSLMSNNLYKSCDITPSTTPHLCGPDERTLPLLRRMYGGSGPVSYARGCTSLDNAVANIPRSDLG